MDSRKISKNTKLDELNDIKYILENKVWLKYENTIKINKIFKIIKLID